MLCCSILLNAFPLRNTSWLGVFFLSCLLPHSEHKLWLEFQWSHEVTGKAEVGDWLQKATGGCISLNHRIAGVGRNLCGFYPWALSGLASQVPEWCAQLTNSLMWVYGEVVTCCRRTRDHDLWSERLFIGRCLHASLLSPQPTGLHTCCLPNILFLSLRQVVSHLPITHFCNTVFWYHYALSSVPRWVLRSAKHLIICQPWVPTPLEII